MNEHHEREQEIFVEAMGKPLNERDAYLESACGKDATLRAQIDSLLRAMDQASNQGFFDHPTGGASGTIEEKTGSGPVHDEEQPGAIIGKYKILEPIGEGGFGSVYRAEQTETIKREVALKIIKLGMDTKQVISRFEAERQALAMMDHPGIATVYDAGSTGTGRPYFVMELVRGLPITEYCDQHQLSIQDRLRLFQRVCAAVQHAHQKGIIHRDIKPSNVLVTDQNERSAPKVIDFGVAKATESSLGDQSIQTEARQLVGTPIYMSPEQAGMSKSDIDTRSDVYSLGVLLYELLTGVTPIDTTTLTRSGYDEIQRMIREVTPPKPSTRLSCAETTIDVAQQRRSELKKLQHEISGDLDWIVMKTIEKDRARRYDSVNALADDIGRYLDNEPVAARPPSGAYKFRKFVQRNRGRVLAGAVLLSVLLLGIAGTTSGLIWALDEREKARLAAADELAAQVEATNAAEQAANEAERATREAQTAEELSRFFVMDVLSAADPARTENKDLTVREALVNASESIEGRFADRPDFESKIHNALGYLFARLGAPDRAEHHHRREWALTKQEHGEVSYENARIMHSVVADLGMRGQDAEAIELTKEQLAIIDQLDTSEAEQLRLRVIGNLGALLVRTGRLVEAAAILEETLESKRKSYGDRHPTTLVTVDSLATVLNQTGAPQRALPLAEEAYNGQAEVLGKGDPRTLYSLVNLSQIYTSLDRLDDAVSLLRLGQDEALQRLGNLHPASLYIRGNYARALSDSGDTQGAEQATLALLPDIEATDPEMLQQQSRSALSVLASCQAKSGRHAEALQTAERMLQSARSVFPADDIRLADFLKLQGDILTDLERFEDAEDTLLEAWKCVDREDITGQQFEPIAWSLARMYKAWDASHPDPGYQEQFQLWQARLDGERTD